MSYKIAVDFDGTIVKHRYPDIGEELPEAFKWLKVFSRLHGAKLILWTMRSGHQLVEAVDFCARHGVTFDAVNEGINDSSWTTSRKAHAHIYIDDSALGCPTIPDDESEGRLMVDWSKVGPAVINIMEGK